MQDVSDASYCVCRQQSDGGRALVGGVTGGRCRGQSWQTGLRWTGGVGQTVPKSSVFIFKGRSSLGHPRLSLLQQRPGLGARLLTLHASVCNVLPLLCRGSALILTRRQVEEEASNILSQIMAPQIQTIFFPNLRWESSQFHWSHSGWWTLSKQTGRHLSRCRRSAKLCFEATASDVNSHGISHACCLVMNHHTANMMMMAMVKIIRNTNTGITKNTEKDWFNLK